MGGGRSPPTERLVKEPGWWGDQPGDVARWSGGHPPPVAEPSGPIEEAFGEEERFVILRASRDWHGWKIAYRRPDHKEKALTDTMQHLPEAHQSNTDHGRCRRTAGRRSAPQTHQ